VMKSNVRPMRRPPITTTLAEVRFNLYKPD
jgi:hypothetical protein